MGDHVGTLEAHIASLASMNTEFADVTKIGIILSALRDKAEFEPLIASV